MISDGDGNLTDEAEDLRMVPPRTIYPKLSALEISESAAERSRLLLLPTSVVTASIWPLFLSDALQQHRTMVDCVFHRF